MINIKRMMINKKAKFPEGFVFERGDFSRSKRLNCYIKSQKIVSNICKILPILSGVYLLLYVCSRIISGGFWDYLLDVSQYLLVAMAAYVVVWLVKNYLSKYFPMIFIPLASLLVVVFVICNIQDDNALGKADILSFSGDFLAFAGTFCLGYYIFIQDKNKEAKEKRANIKRLIGIVEKLDIETLKLVRHNLTNAINYDQEWLSYYLDYEGLQGSDSDLKQYYDSYFRHIESINQELEKGDITKAERLEKEYMHDQNYSIQKYNHYEALSKLVDSLYDDKFVVSVSWLEKKENVDLINRLCREYFYIIENYVYNWLIKNNRDCVSVFDIEYELTDWLVENAPGIKEIIRFSSDRRIVCKAIHNCSLQFNQYSKKLDYVWAEYLLKHNTKEDG